MTDIPEAREPHSNIVRPNRRHVMRLALGSALTGAAAIALGMGRAEANDCTNACAAWLVRCLNYCKKIGQGGDTVCTKACNSEYKECLDCCAAGGSGCTPPEPPDTAVNPNFITSLMFLPGVAVTANSGKARLQMQGDGNFVVYDENDHARWASNTVKKGAFAEMQFDGNLVVYNGGNKPVWASNTCCRSDAHLAVQDDGNVVIYDSAGHIWATNTKH